ncbi:MAG: hypothetical protein AAF739_00320 [Pseudomonadota bacterium]
MKFTVKRPHQGDRWYNVGDTREATETSVKHLVAKGVLVPVEAGGKTKAATKPANKGAPTVQNKAADA